MTYRFDQILDRFDFAFTEGCSQADRTCLFCKEATWVEGTVFEFTAVAPQGISSACAKADILRYLVDHDVAKVRVDWPTQEPPCPSGVYVLCNVHRQPAASMFVVDAQCIPVKLNAPSLNTCGIVELCAGGFGGWHKAGIFLERFMALGFRVLSIEACLETAWTFAVSNCIPIASGFSPLPESFVRACTHLVLHADVCSPTWYPVAGLWGADVFTISAPCQPWSSAGSSEGMDCDTGAILAECVAVCKIFRPKVVLLEQVVGFAGHPHKEFILRLLRWAGYVLRFQKVVDSGDVTAATRPRWLALATLADDQHLKTAEFKFWDKISGLSPQSFGSVLSTPWTEDARLWPTKEVVALASDPALLPPAKRGRIDKAQVFRSRCLTPATKAPTIVASYGSQHCLAESSLEARGLLCHFVDDVKGPRFWHPIELLCMHAMVGNQLILEPWPKAYKHIGNQISVPHALLMLLNALEYLPNKDVSLDFQEIFRQLQIQHVTVGNAHITQLSLGLFVSDSPFALVDSQIRHIQDFWQIVQGVLPDNQSWSINGFCWLMQPQAPVAAALDFPLAPTQAFVVFLPATFIDRPLAKVQIASDLDTLDLGHAWNGLFDFFLTPGQGFHIVLALEPNPPARDRLLFAWLGGILYVLRPDEPAQTWLHDQGIAQFHDVLGLLDLGHFARALLIHDQDPAPVVSLGCSVTNFVVLSQQCTYEVFQLDDGSAFGFVCAGPPKAVLLLLHFWKQQLQDPLLVSLGFRLQLTERESSFHLSLLSDASCPILPLHLLCLRIFGASLASVLKPLTIKGDTITSLHYGGRTLWANRLPGGFTVDFLMAVIGAVSFWITPTLRVLHLGKQIDWNLTLAETKGPREFLKLSLMLPIRGGGPTGTKNSHKLQVQNALATVLLDEGHDLHWVTTSIATVMTKVGLKELSKALSANQTTRLQLAHQALRDCNIALPDQKPMLISQANFLKKKKTQNNVMPHPANYRITEGSLLNQDDTPLEYVPTFGGQVTGYHCITPSDARPWLSATDTLSRDELILLIFGEIDCAISRPHEKITVPCTDERGNQVLASVTMVQFGDKHVKKNAGDGFKVDAAETTLLAVTLEAEDHPDDWQDIARSTYKFLRAQPFLQDMILSVWGRSLRRGKNVATTTDCTSIQVHMLVPSDKLAAIVKSAGNAQIWCTPKNADGRPDSNWKLLWLPQDADLKAASIASAKLPHAVGITKVRGRFAIRVSKANYAGSWSLLFPGVAPPEMVDANTTWRIDSLPFGVTKDMLLAWAKHHQWAIRPLRAIGPRGWVVVAATAPPKPQMLFNLDPVLIRELAPRAVQSNPIVAGPRPSKPASVDDKSGKLPPLAGDPWATNPWAAWKGTGSAAPAVPTTRPATTTSHSPTFCCPRSSIGQAWDSFGCHEGQPNRTSCQCSEAGQWNAWPWHRDSQAPWHSPWGRQEGAGLNIHNCPHSPICDNWEGDARPEAIVPCPSEAK